MQMSIDGLLVALLVVLAPEQEPTMTNERALAGLAPDPQVQQERRDSAMTTDPSACRYFADQEARRKCAIRTSRPVASGAPNPISTYPETLIWLAPSEPSMPYKFQPNPLR
jgi:hypothetical protein